MSRKHYPISPSDMARVIQCPGSLNMVRELTDKEVPEEDEEVRARGERGHAVVEQCLLDPMLSPSEMIDDDPHLAQSIEIALGRIDKFRSSVHVIAEFVEVTVELPDDPLIGGTPDYVLIYLDLTTLEIGCLIVDFKFGRLDVDVQENPQIMAYARIYSEKYPYIDTFDGWVIQPGGGGITEEPWTREQLRTFMRQFLAKSHSTKLKLNSGCRYCPARLICPEMRQTLMGVAELAQRVNHGDTKVSDLSSEQTVMLVKNRTMLTKMLDDLAKKVKNLMLTGDTVPGLKLGTHYAPRRWRFDVDEVVKRLEERGLNSESLFIPAKLKSPAQIDGDGHNELIEDLYEKPTSPMVVPESRNVEPYVPPPVDEFDDIT